MIGHALLSENRVSVSGEFAVIAVDIIFAVHLSDRYDVAIGETVHGAHGHDNALAK